MWGDAQDTELAERVQNAKFTYGVAKTSTDGTRTTIPEDEVKEQKDIAKEALKEKIAAMAILKRAEKGGMEIYRLV